MLTSDPGKEFRGPDTNGWVSPRSDEGRHGPEQIGSQTAFAAGRPTVHNSGLAGSYREAEDIELIFHKKGGATVSLVQLLGVAAITALLALAWDNRFALLQTQLDAVSYASSPVVFMPRIPEPAPSQATAAMVSKDSSKEITPQPINRFSNPVKSKKRKLNEDKVATSTTAIPGSAEEEVDIQEVKEAPPVIEAAPVKTEIVEAPSASTPGDVNDGEQVKKKTLGQAIKGLFKKKNKEGRKMEEKTEQ
jgi:hypothetical protein